MNLDEWVDLLKNTTGPAEFKGIALEFLREFYDAPVQYTDGTGDGGVDAWVILANEPMRRIAAQLHAGKAEAWDKKLLDDVESMVAFRDHLGADDPRRLDLERLLFVCTQTPSASKVETVAEQVRRQHGISVSVFDARAIVSHALQRRGRLLDLLARGALGDRVAESRARSARDEAILSFSFFHGTPAKYRWAVAKSSIATVLHRRQEPVERDRLIAEAADLLRVSLPSRLLERTLRNLELERNVAVEFDAVVAMPALAERTQTALAIAAKEEELLRARLASRLEPILPKGTHHRDERARRAVDVVFDDLGLLVRGSIAEVATGAAGQRPVSRRRADEASHRRWSIIEHSLAQELTLSHGELAHVLEILVREVADSPFAQSLAAAELFLRLTEYDATELAQTLEAASPLQVTIDASIAMPMLCALYDRPATHWMTSVAAHELFEALRRRGARCVVPSVYVEEIASHLLKAREFENLVATEPELERSGNYFVAHYCSTRGEAGGEPRSVATFREFLAAFGATRLSVGDRQSDGRRQAEGEIARILGRYDIAVCDVTCRIDDPKLADEPLRADVLLRHDRAVTRWLTAPESAGGPRPLVCTADLWLQGILNDLGVVAINSVGLLDMMELVRPLGSHRSLLSPLMLARTISEEDRALAAQVWDRLVELEGGHFADWQLVQRAREFRTRWLQEQREPSTLGAEWVKFRVVDPVAEA